jgi:translation initiation factor RLI1
MAEESKSEPISENSASLIANSLDSDMSYSLEKEFHRDDVVLKSAIRSFRKYFRNQYKNKFKKLVKKRYVNCKPKEIYDSVFSLLQNTFEMQNLDEDMVYYLVGILNLRPINHLSCRMIIKKEVTDFLACVRSFSIYKFLKIFESDCLKVLIRLAVERSNRDKQICELEPYLKEGN